VNQDLKIDDVARLRINILGCVAEHAKLNPFAAPAVRLKFAMAGVAGFGRRDKARDRRFTLAAQTCKLIGRHVARRESPQRLRRG
jgi:hypothetical protein